MISSFFKDIGIDLGTANSLVYLKGRGVVVQEPSIAAVNNKTGQVLAIGEEAKKMLSRTPQHISVIRPLTNGVISDFEMTQEMLRYFLKRVGKDRLFNYRRAVLGIPGNLTEVERKSVEDAAVGAGVRTVHLIEEPVASAARRRSPSSRWAAS
ncbi:MAG: Rod shape-determining protein, subunit B [Parcubacteria group bacterium GW2011_GWA1_60_11]|nr:MAG: Rod shape-determining protein, subunit B [Parcubacteria group bacterium GW2011_GWA1_60_11]